MPNQLTNLQIRDSFIEREEILNVLYSYKTKMNFDFSSCENQKQKNKVAKEFKQKIFTKLNSIFRRQIILSCDEAIKFYSDNEDVLKERIDIFFEIIEYISEQLDIVLIPDRLFVCSYFRIDAETYNIILNDPRADVGNMLKIQFRNLEEFIISMTTNGLENGELTGYAWKKMQLKAEYGGNEIKSVEANMQKGNSIVITTSEDVQKRLNTSYNFPELLEKKDN